jgi:hypothetical protein
LGLLHEIGHIFIEKRKYMKELSEEKEQELIIKWSKGSILKEYPELELLEASMNGVRFPPKWKGLIAKLKRLGCLKKGRPDLHLPVMRGGYAALFIELKREKSGVVSDEQGFYMVDLQKTGNFCAVCHGRHAAKKLIIKYLSGKLQNYSDHYPI